MIDSNICMSHFFNSLGGLFDLTSKQTYLKKHSSSNADLFIEVDQSCVGTAWRDVSNTLAESYSQLVDDTEFKARLNAFHQLEAFSGRSVDIGNLSNISVDDLSISVLCDDDNINHNNHNLKGVSATKQLTLFNHEEVA